jgi:hypothetical protein
LTVSLDGVQISKARGSCHILGIFAPAKNLLAKKLQIVDTDRYNFDVFSLGSDAVLLTEFSR